MLIIDDNMFRLAKMQEKLLKVSNINREENLNKYKQTILQIDAQAYSSLLEEIKKIDDHNQSLENELKFLENIKYAYEQLLELQQNFKNLCELYGKEELKLSDLSNLNIEYIENRINAINGYLQNIKNIETNKIRIEDLNESLIDEEKKKIYLDHKLSSLEKALRENFLNAEGRYIIDGKLIPTSVILEYKSIDIDINQLLSNNELLEEQIIKFTEEKRETTEKLRTAEVCYNNISNEESKQILEEIQIDELKARYKVTMLKILKLISKNMDNYDEVKAKRENLLELIKYRLYCLEELGNHISIDPFGRTKIKEQLDIINSITNNTEVINKLRKELSELNSRTEEMISQNNNYLILLSDTKKIIENKIGLNDITKTHIDLKNEKTKNKIITANQIIKIINIPSTINIDRVNQKTTGVIKRVNQMINGPRIKETEKTIVEPDLIIIPKNESNVNEESNIVLLETPNSIEEKEIVEIDLTETTNELTLDDAKEEIMEEKTPTTEVKKIPSNISVELFETVSPFTEPQLFMDRNDEEPLKTEQPPVITFPEFNVNEPQVTPELSSSDSLEMPQAFWPTQEDSSETVTNINDEKLSFDEQINILMSTENNDKKLKKIA